MAFAQMFPEIVHQLVCLDAPPVDRRAFPELNVTTDIMIEEAHALGNLSHLGLLSARKHIERVIKDPVLKQALQFNLNDDATWACNIASIYQNKNEIYSYDDFGSYYGPTLFINGEHSYQRPI